MQTNTNEIPFTYVVPAITLAANASGQQNLVLMADSYFELAYIFATGGVDATTENTLINPNNFSLLIQDNTTGRALMSARVPQRILCGNAFNGFPQRRPTVFEPQSNLLFDYLNLTAGNNTVTIAMVGYKQMI